MTGRLVWVDWLKALVVLGVVAYHAAQPFVLTDWIVRNDERSIGLSALAAIGYLFAMPLMFLLAGSASWLALERRTVREYVGIRLLRLGVPLVAGLLLLSPLESWVGELSRGHEVPYLTFLGSYLGEIRLRASPGWMGEYGHHLWFLGFLLAYVLVTLPALVWLRRRAGLPRPHPAIALGGLALLLVVTQWLLRPAFPDYRDWADALLWLVYFGVGIVIVADARLAAAIRARGLWFAPAAAIVGLGFLGLAPERQVLSLEGAPTRDLAGLWYGATRTLVGLSLVVACLAIGMRWLTGQAALAERAGESTLAFYVLHHPIAVVLAALVVDMGGGPWPKFALILAATLLATFAAYEWGVRRVEPLRRVFGVRRPTTAGAGWDRRLEHPPAVPHR